MAGKRSRSKRFRDWMIYILSRGLFAAGRIIPAKFGAMKGSLLGSLAFRFSKRERRKAVKNIRMAFGESISEKESRVVARESFRHFGKVLFEVLKIRNLNRKTIEKKFVFEGLDVVTEAIKSKRGIVVATGHIGNWELMGAAAAQLGVPVNVIARQINDNRLNDLVIKLRADAGVKTIVRESAESAKMMLRSLKRGEMLALLIDQDLKTEGVFVPFFGRDAWTPVGAAALAYRSGAVFAAASVHRLEDGKHLVRVKAIDIDDELERDHAIIDATGRATKQLEQWIREKPEQWAWFHDRWKTRPDEGNSEDAQ